MKEVILKIMAGYGLDAALQPAIEAAFTAGVQSTQCYLFARPQAKAEWTCVCCDDPAACFTPEMYSLDADTQDGGPYCDNCCPDEGHGGLCLPIEDAPPWWPKAADGSPAWVQVHEDGASWSLVPDGTRPSDQQIIPCNDVGHTCAEFCDQMEAPFEFRQEPLDGTQQ